MQEVAGPAHDPSDTWSTSPGSRPTAKKPPAAVLSAPSPVAHQPGT
ncbi:hypothetical protein [Streptomyces sp. NPDC096132]